MTGEEIVVRVRLAESPNVAAVVEFVDGSEETIRPVPAAPGRFFYCGQSGRYPSLVAAVDGATKGRERQLDRELERAATR